MKKKNKKQLEEKKHIYVETDFPNLNNSKTPIKHSSNISISYSDMAKKPILPNKPIYSPILKIESSIREADKFNKDEFVPINIYPKKKSYLKNNWDDEYDSKNLYLDNFNEENSESNNSHSEWSDDEFTDEEI